MSKLNKLYESILAFASLYPDENGRVEFMVNGKRREFTIDGKKLVLPTQHWLRNPNNEEIMVFHPLQEHIDRGEPEIVTKLRGAINTRLNIAIVALLSGLFEIAESSADHQLFNPQQRDFIKDLKHVKEKTAEGFLSFIMRYFKHAPSAFFTHIFVKRSGLYRNTKYSRVGITTFPIYDLLKSRKIRVDTELKEVKFDRVNDPVAIGEMMSLVFPDSDTDPEAYNAPVGNHRAPWLNALLQAAYKVAERISELAALFPEKFGDVDELKFDTFWFEEFDNLDAYRSEILRIPSQRGNEGVSETPAKKQEPAVQQQPRPAPVHPNAPQNQVQQSGIISSMNQPAPTPVDQASLMTSDGKLNLGAALASRGGMMQQQQYQQYQQQQQQMMMQQQPMNQGSWATQRMGGVSNMGGGFQQNMPLTAQQQQIQNWCQPFNPNIPGYVTPAPNNGQVVYQNGQAFVLTPVQNQMPQQQNVRGFGNDGTFIP